MPFLGLHFQQDFRGALFGQIGQQVGGRVGFHFFDDFRRALRVERLEDCLLHFGLDFFQGPGGYVLVQGLEHGLALVGSQVFDDIRDVGRMQFGQALVGNLELYPAGRIGFDEVDKVPGNGSRGDLPQQGPQRDQREPRPSAIAGLRLAGPTSTEPTFRTRPVGDGFLKKIEIVDPDDFSAENVDDLLIEQIAAQQKHAFRRRRRLPSRRWATSVRIPPLIEVTEANGSRRSPLPVLMISTATRARSSCGISATSRTRAAAASGGVKHRRAQQFGKRESRHASENTQLTGQESTGAL